MLKYLLGFIVAALMIGHAWAENFQADAKINITSVIISNTSNTARVVTTRPATVYGVDASNMSNRPVFVKLYNAASGTCGSGTPFARYTVISSGNTLSVNTNGDAYSTGVVMCIVTGIGDSDATAPDALSGTVNLHWKQSVSP